MSAPGLSANTYPLLNHPSSQSRCFPRAPGPRQVPCSRTYSITASPPMATEHQPLAKGTQVTSSSGRTYIIKEVIYQRSRGRLLCCLYRASHERKQYVLKDILPGDWQYNLDLQNLIAGSAHVRTLVDSIPNHHMFVYPFLDTNLQLVDITAIAPSVRKSILKDALADLADLHDKSIYHTDIKPANIMMDSFVQGDGTIGFRNVRITDLEDGVVLPPGSPGLGKRLSGNQFWRSPQAWARAAQHTPSDIVSFGIVDVDDFDGFVEYHGGEENPFVQRFGNLLLTFDSADKKRKPFSHWYPVDPQFKDLVSKMTRLDPRRRITAREALKHPWFNE
ncbi:kinase-like protein [Canariomyces notabilis]|uniref:non-specific serine/threonine protein kinase n=1 Tax=Canariomyces notabilis TaxID=2074819 RepID=A0AAN6QGM1_9PEZI|nr:kinase-like protein [Canariomyces arenarius]